MGVLCAFVTTTLSADVYCGLAMLFVFDRHEQSPDALASGLWNGEFGGDLLSHG